MHIMESSLQLLLGILIRPRYQSPNLNLPTLPRAIWCINPSNLSQRCPFSSINPVNPKRSTIPLRHDRDCFLPLSDLVIRVREGGDGPIRPLVATDDAEAGSVIVEFYASFDPFIGFCGRVVKLENESGLVVLAGVGERERYGCRDQMGKGCD